MLEKIVKLGVIALAGIVVGSFSIGLLGKIDNSGTFGNQGFGTTATESRNEAGTQNQMQMNGNQGQMPMNGYQGQTPMMNFQGQVPMGNYQGQMSGMQMNDQNQMGGMGMDKKEMGMGMM